MVQSSRLGRGAVVYFQIVGAYSNSEGSRLEMCFRETLIAVLAPVTKFSVVCFERVTSISVCGAEPVRNGRFGGEYASGGWGTRTSHPSGRTQKPRF